MKHTESKAITPMLLDAVRTGDMEAFEVLYLRYASSVENFLSALVRSADVGTELTQDVFVTLWERRENIDPERNISGYIYTIAKNHAFKYLNRRKSIVTDEIASVEFVSETFSAPDSSIMARELELLIDLVVEQMPPARRNVFELSRKDGMSNSEIATRLGISKNTVENHITAALKEIRQFIGLVIALVFFL